MADAARLVDDSRDAPLLAVSHVALVTCSIPDVDPDDALLLAAVAATGHSVRQVVWDDPAVDWDEFDLTVIRSTWDYTPRREEFVAWARRVPRLRNSATLVEYSTDKHYLADLAARGFPVVATTFCDVGGDPVFPASDFVVKPAVGAGSMEADRYRPEEIERASAHVRRLHAMGRDVLIQPYVDSVDLVGERAVIMIDGQFSHAMTKSAMLNVEPDDRTALFRREQMSRASVEPEAQALAESILATIDDDVLYGRVDLVATPEGWAVMELELVEPSLFLSYDEEAAPRLARAIARRVS